MIGFTKPYKEEICRLNEEIRSLKREVKRLSLQNDILKLYKDIPTASNITVPKNAPTTPTRYHETACADFTLTDTLVAYAAIELLSNDDVSSYNDASSCSDSYDCGSSDCDCGGSCD